MANIELKMCGHALPTNFATSMMKAVQAAQSIHELIEAATRGDKHAIEFVFNQGGRLAFTCTHLAGDEAHAATIGPIVEKMACVPVIYSGVKSSDEQALSVYNKFKIGRQKQPFKAGTWWDNESEASRSIAETLAIMASVRIEAKAKPKKQWSKAERICAELH